MLIFDVVYGSRILSLLLCTLADIKPNLISYILVSFGFPWELIFLLITIGVCESLVHSNNDRVGMAHEIKSSKITPNFPRPPWGSIG